MPYLLLLRPQQWIKNIFIFAALIFGHELTNPASVALTLLGFACLCLVSSSVYIINDIHDRDEDRLHPRKSRRPVASGAVSARAAAGAAAALLLAGLGGSWLLDRAFGMVAGVYFLLQFAYTFGFKHAVILDVIAIGLGFVLRAVSGAVLLHVAISPWLVICTFTLCLFMGFSKRRCELNALSGAGGNHASLHRRTLSIYTPELLNHMTTLTAGIAVVTFLLYAMDQRTVDQFGRFGANALLGTLPIVVYAVFRFTVLVEHGEVDGPTDVMLKDRPFQCAIAIWIAAALAIVYLNEPIKSMLARILETGAPAN